MNTTAPNRCRQLSWGGALVWTFVATLLEVVCWGFTVDDAWIVSRVAAHGAETARFSFNINGPVTDAVTPWGFAHLLAAMGKLLGAEGPLPLWTLARWLGVVSYAISFLLAGLWIGRERGNEGEPSGAASWLDLMSRSLLVLLCLPAALWAGAGLTTPIVGLVLLVSARGLEVDASPLGRFARALALGLPAVWRPELLPAICAIAWVTTRDRPLVKSMTAVGLCVVPFVLVAVARLFTFGRALPLSAVAKEASVDSGLFYAAVTALWGGLPWLLLACPGFFRGPKPWGWVFGVHLLGLVYAGGDWMPALRLTAPLYPWLLWKIGSHLEWRRASFVCLLPAVAFPVLLFVQQGPDLRAVTDRRLALVEAGRAALEGSSVVAATDVGWVGLATDAIIVDLAGVTDDRIAELPGGHTSKMVSPGLFSDRNVDAWVVRSLSRGHRPGDPPELIVAAYAVDARLLKRTADLGLIATQTIPLGGTDGEYVVFRRSMLAER